MGEQASSIASLKSLFTCSDEYLSILIGYDSKQKSFCFLPLALFPRDLY
jgi:hypothetical protein